MNRNKYLTSEDVYCSYLYGDGAYRLDMGREYVQDLGGDRGAGRYSPVLTNMLTGESYFAKRMNPGTGMERRLESQILTPPDRRYVLWPSDMVYLSPEHVSQFTVQVAQQYTDTPVELDYASGAWALLFPYDDYTALVSADDKRKRIHGKNWQNPEIRSMAYQILVAMDSINRAGYVYDDIHLSRIFFRKDGSAYLNYSNLIYSIKETQAWNADRLCQPAYGWFPLEFAEPAYVHYMRRRMNDQSHDWKGQQESIDYNSQNYSLCALLFYLFYGRYCYKGALLDGNLDDMDGNLFSQQHYSLFDVYHKMPRFIFNLAEDNPNRLGDFEEELEVIELWESSPEELKELFMGTLMEVNALRKQEVHNPTPATWLRIFRKLGWDKN